MVVGSDLDGVIALHLKPKSNYKSLKQYYQEAILGFVPPDLEIIITGRRETFRKLTESWLEKYNISYKKLIMYPKGLPKTKRLLAIFKAKQILKHGVSVFYEDDPLIAKYLALRTPATVIFIKTPNLSKAGGK